MRFPTYLVRRGDVYYYRAKVPSDIVDRLQRREVWVSLRSTDRKTAEIKLADVHLSQLRLYESLRNGSSAPSISPRHSAKPFKSAHEPPGRTIDELLGYWARQSEKRPRTLLDANTAVSRLKAVLAHNSANDVTRRHAISFKDALIAEGLAHNTITKNFGLIKSIFEVGCRNDLVPANPFTEIKIAKPARQEKPRLSFTHQDLQLIFASPVFTNKFRPTGGAGDAAVWIPLIAMMTGMRLEEIGQLRKADFKNADGIWFIDLDYLPAQGRWLKNDSSRRLIPVHKTLVNIGLKDLVDQSNDRLFPLLYSAGSRQLTASWSQWFGRYLRKQIGIEDVRKTFHSFRHTFKDLCREAGIPKDVHDRLTGHKSSDVGDGYGAATYPLRPLAEAVQKLQFPVDFDEVVL